MSSSSRPGRHRAPPILGAGASVLALDLGGTWIRASIVGSDGTILTRARRLTLAQRPAAAIVGDCIETLREARAASPPGASARPGGIGIGAPGPVDTVHGMLVEPPNLPTCRDVRLAAELAEALDLPAILARDTNVAALGEGAFGAARHVDEFVYLTVSTGIGGAVVSRGRLLEGIDGMAGELGHVTIQVDGPRCSCGARGHLEAISAGPAIARAGRLAAVTWRSPLLAEAAGRIGLDRLDAADVARAEEAGDLEAIAIMTHARRAFAAAVAGIANAFSPARIVVGGSVARGLGDRWLAPAREAARTGGFSPAARRVEVVAAALGDDAVLAGSVPLLASRLR